MRDWTKPRVKFNHFKNRDRSRKKRAKSIKLSTNHQTQKRLLLKKKMLLKDGQLKRSSEEIWMLLIRI
jgi:hypothetical protein